MCKHGQCRKGESTCSKCDKGWTGMPMCDVKVEETPSKISRRKSDVENMSNQYSQQMKPQVFSESREDRMEEPDKEGSSSNM